MTYSKEIIKKIYRSLPDELKQIVATEETSAINNNIAKAYNLNSQQRLEMGDEITMRLLGITSKEVFATNLGSRLKIDSEIAQKIANDVKTRILAKIPEKILIAQQEYVQAKITKPAVPEIAPVNLPMVESGEVAHDVPPARQGLAGSQPKVSLPDYRYEGGKDPYREPLK